MEVRSLKKILSTLLMIILLVSGCTYKDSTSELKQEQIDALMEQYSATFEPAYDKNEKLKLEQQQLEKIQNLWDCKVSDYQLHLTEDGAYEIVEATENENGEMTVKIIEKGFCK